MTSVMPASKVEEGLTSYNRTFQVAGMKAICKEDQLSQLLYGELEKAIKKQGDLKFGFNKEVD
jgi:hypothetical protein